MTKIIGKIQIYKSESFKTSEIKAKLNSACESVYNLNSFKN